MKKFKLAKEKWYFQSLRETKSVKELDDWAVEISWYASTKDKDRWWDIVEPKAFQSALERYMTNPIVLLQHKADKPIGVVESAEIDDNWLRIKAKISQNTDWVVDLIKNWVLRAFSIWYSVKDYDTDVRELADWTYDMTNIIKDLELYEISVVSIPMNPYALSKSIEDLFEVEEVEDKKSDEETVEDVEEEKVEESETVEEWKDEIKEEEKSVDNWSESDQNDEQIEEWTNVQDEEKTDESETEEKEEFENIFDDEKKEERPNEEVETKEMNEEKDENVDNHEAVEETVEQNADEQSEIDEESVEKDSENAVETQTNDEEVVETHNDEIVETKSIETESQKQFDFESKIEQLQKSFDEKLSIKEEKIKELESRVEKMTQLFADSIDTIDRMATNVKNTPVNSGLQYKRPLKKWWYYDIASIIKSL